MALDGLEVLSVSFSALIREGMVTAQNFSLLTFVIVVTVTVQGLWSLKWEVTVFFLFRTSGTTYLKATVMFNNWNERSCSGENPYWELGGLKDDWIALYQTSLWSLEISNGMKSLFCGLSPAMPEFQYVFHAPQPRAGRKKLSIR